MKRGQFDVASPCHHHRRVADLGAASPAICAWNLRREEWLWIRRTGYGTGLRDRARSPVAFPLPEIRTPTPASMFAVAEPQGKVPRYSLRPGRGASSWSQLAVGRGARRKRTRRQRRRRRAPWSPNDRLNSSTWRDEQDRDRPDCAPASCVVPGIEVPLPVRRRRERSSCGDGSVITHRTRDRRARYRAAPGNELSRDGVRGPPASAPVSGSALRTPIERAPAPGQAELMTRPSNQEGRVR